MFSSKWLDKNTGGFVFKRCLRFAIAVGAAAGMSLSLSAYTMQCGGNGSITIEEGALYGTVTDCWGKKCRTWTGWIPTCAKWCGNAAAA
jgi:hypothetical protein